MKEIVEDNQMGDSATAAVTCESRREAAKLHNVGKHEPKLTENGIPADVLEKLLPGNDIVELENLSLMAGCSIALLNDPLTLFPAVVP